MALVSLMTMLGVVWAESPEVGAVLELSHAPECLTGQMHALRQGLDAMDATQREAALNVLEPWRKAWAERGAPPPEPCVGHYGEKYIVGEHFSVEWDGNTIDENTAQRFLDSLEYSWSVEVDELGWIGPSGATSTQILVYIDAGGSAGAYTSVTNCNQGPVSAMPYIVAYAGSFQAGTWYRTMAAHEFNHASQFYYGYAHEFYFWEATATWMEEYVYEDHNDWANSIAYGYSDQPHIAMNASDQQDASVFWHMYAMAIWNIYLDEYIGGHDLILEMWEKASRQNGNYSYWMPEVIEDVGLDFAETYAGFLAAVAVMDFREKRYYRMPTLADSTSSLPASGESGRNAPQSLGQNFIKIAAGAAEDGELVQVSFDGQDGVDWFVVLVRGEDSELDTYVSLELDENNEGTGTIEAVSGKDIYIVVSPMDEDAVGFHYNWSRADEFEYAWSAEVTEPDTTDPDAGGDSGVTGDGKESSGGACATGVGASGVGWVLALALAGWRRRACE